MLIDKTLKPNYYSITLLILDPKDPTQTKMIEADPMTIEQGVFMDKDCKIPAPISDMRYHLTPEEHDLLRKSPEEGGFLILNERGYLPLEYFDKHVLALYYEFDSVADMLANNDYDPVLHHGHLVMVRDFGDDPVIPNAKEGYWAVYRLNGDNPRDRLSWEPIFQQQLFRDDVTWANVDPGFRATVEEIDRLVADAHQHINKEILKRFTVNADGRLCFDGVKLTLRKDFRAINILTKPPYGELLVGDMGHDISYHGDYQPTSDNDYEGMPYLTGDISGYYEGDETLIVPPKMNVTNADKMNRFFKNCINLTTIPFMDIAGVKEFEEFCENCKSLTTVTTMYYTQARTMHKAFANCTALTTMPELDLSRCEDISYIFLYDTNLTHIGDIKGYSITEASCAFMGCNSLKTLPRVDLSKVENLSSLCAGCVSMESASINSEAAITLEDAFFACGELTEVVVDMSSCEDATDIFKGCNKLVDVTINGELHTSIDFSETAISLASATMIVDNLPEVRHPQTLIFTGTPGSRVNSYSVAKAERKGWTIIR